MVIVFVLQLNIVFLGFLLCSLSIREVISPCHLGERAGGNIVPESQRSILYVTRFIAYEWVTRLRGFSVFVTVYRNSGFTATRG